MTAYVHGYDQFACNIAWMPFITAAEKVTLTSCRHSASQQQWQASDPRMAKKRDFINTTSLKAASTCVCGACCRVMGGTNTRMHTHTQVDTHTLIPCSGLTHNIDSKYSGLVCAENQSHCVIIQPASYHI